MSRTLPKTRDLLNLIIALRNQSLDVADCAVLSDANDRQVYEEISRLCGELLLAEQRLARVLRAAEAAVLRTDAGTEITTTHN